MTTSEERREIADMMRDPFDVIKIGRYTYLDGTLFGMQMCARNEMALRNDMRHLADLIDPTCEVVGITSDRGLYYPTVWHYRLSCGHTYDSEGQELPDYCPYCGARVVSCDDN